LRIAMIGFLPATRDGRHSREELYLQMARMRRMEVELGELWQRGLISGELHLGIGEEAVAAGVLAHVHDGDALAVDHRSTPPFVARGSSLTAIVAEMLGSEAGLCRGRGGHMHLFDKERLAASSGIVGAAGPLGCGFALAAQGLRPGGVAVAFFGEGAINQGMLLESLNLAAVWRLPVLFVCKDSGFAITTRSKTVTAGSVTNRARSFGIPVSRVDGSDVEAVRKAAGAGIGRARAGRGPSFILARCHRRGGHFLGDPLLRLLEHPVDEGRSIAPGLTAAAVRRSGARGSQRMAGLARITSVLASFAGERWLLARDPLQRQRRRLAPDTARALERSAHDEVEHAVRDALAAAGVSP
jgi:acetoin:2,6-dichlorophenolindophenol oxidoreductase subunit alpha